MGVTIRKAKEEDLNELARVESESFPPAEAAGRETFRTRFEAFPDSFLVAEEDGRMIGFVNGCVTDERTIRDVMFEDSSTHNPNGAYQSIFGLDVLPEYRRRGIAAQLMESLIEEAERQGRRGMILTCKDRLIHYYEKFGYVNHGISESVHGGAVWYDMILEF